MSQARPNSDVPTPLPIAVVQLRGHERHGFWSCFVCKKQAQEAAEPTRPPPLTLYKSSGIEGVDS
jgi:hypothetical protein